MLDGEADHAYAYSMILTTLTDDAVEIEAWFRGRVSIEDRIREAKLGFGLRHLPSGKDEINQLWLLGAISALNLSALTQALAATGPRAHAKRLRFELLNIPGRVLRHARQVVLRVPNSAGRLVEAHRRLHLLPSPAP
ncbi:MAG: transposase [Acidimicrobiia bacterium]|nr:transposase [Acidimicrobiia bacterium]